MRVCDRPYDDSQKDFIKLWAFIVDDYADKQDHFVWSLGRLGEWKYHLNTGDRRNVDFPDFFRNNAHLWLNNNDECVGFAISECGNSEFYVLARRGHEFLYREMLDWVKNNWQNRGKPPRTAVDPHQSQYIKALCPCGFVAEEPVAVTRQYDLKNMSIMEAPLPLGYAMTDMFAAPDEIGSINLGMNAWRKSTDEVSAAHVQKFRYRRENPCYFAHMDIYATDEQGLCVAGCNAFVDYKNSYAEIERVCTHIDYRKRGLAQAVIAECLRRLQAENVAHAYITGMSEAAIALYGKLDFAKERTWIRYALSV